MQFVLLFICQMKPCAQLYAVPLPGWLWHDIRNLNPQDEPARWVAQGENLGGESILSIWQLKEGAVLWVDTQPAGEEAGERGFVSLNAWSSLCWDKRVSNSAETSCLPSPFDPEGREVLCGEDGVKTGEMREGRMKDAGEVVGGISHWP